MKLLFFNLVHLVALGTEDSYAGWIYFTGYGYPGTSCGVWVRRDWVVSGEQPVISDYEFLWNF